MKRCEIIKRKMHRRRYISGGPGRRKKRKGNGQAKKNINQKQAFKHKTIQRKVEMQSLVKRCSVSECGNCGGQKFRTECWNAYMYVCMYVCMICMYEVT